MNDITEGKGGSYKINEDGSVELVERTDHAPEQPAQPEVNTEHATEEHNDDGTA